MARIPIKDATTEQLAEFALTNLGIDLRSGYNRNQVMSQITATGFSGTEIDVEDATAAAGGMEEQRVKKLMASEHVEDEPLYDILIPETKDNGGSEPVPVPVNGVVCLIKRGVVVPGVKKRYVEALQNAQALQYQRGPNGEPINPRPVMSFPFQIVRGPYQDDRKPRKQRAA